LSWLKIFRGKDARQAARDEQTVYAVDGSFRDWLGTSTMAGRVFGLAVIGLILAGFFAFPLLACRGDGERVLLCAIAGMGFVAIASGGLFFSYRPRLFVRCFLPRYVWREWRHTIGRIRRDPGRFGAKMRWIVALQFVAAVFLLLGTAVSWILYR
jgi:hypothetical protein